VAVAHRRRVLPVEGDVEALRVVHHRHLGTVDIAERFQVVADQDLPRQVPIVQLPVDRHLARGRHGVDPVVIGLLAPNR
jgi:hypothetical protein